MLETYFSRPSTIDRLRCGPLGSDLDELSAALQHQGYARDSIRGYLRGCDQFARWLPQHGYAIEDVNPTLVKRYISGLQRPPSGRLPKAAEGLSHLLKLWRQKNRLPERIEESPRTAADYWLLCYEQYLDQVCGTAVSTRSHYLRMTRRFLESGQKRGLRSNLQLGLRFLRHPWVPVLKTRAQVFVEDLGSNL